MAMASWPVMAWAFVPIAIPLRIEATEMTPIANVFCADAAAWLQIASELVPLAALLYPMETADVAVAAAPGAEASPDPIATVAIPEERAPAIADPLLAPMAIAP